MRKEIGCRDVPSSTNDYEADLLGEENLQAGVRLAEANHFAGGYLEQAQFACAPGLKLNLVACQRLLEQITNPCVPTKERYVNLRLNDCLS